MNTLGCWGQVDAAAPLSTDLWVSVSGQVGSIEVIKREFART